MTSRIYMSVATIGTTSIYSGTGVPAFTAARGSLAMRTDVAELYQNTDGAATWVLIGSGGSGGSNLFDTQIGRVSATMTPGTYGFAGFITEISAVADGGDTGIRTVAGIAGILTTDGTLNNNAHITIVTIEGDEEIIFPNSRPIIEHRFKFPDRTTDVRFFTGIGQFDLVSPAINANPDVPHVGLQFDTARGDLTLQISSQNDTGEAQNLIDTGVAPVANLTYRLSISANSTTSWVVTLFSDAPGTGDADDPVSEQLFTTTIVDPAQIPTYGIGLAWCVGVNNLAGAAVNFGHYFANIALRSGVQT